MRARRMLSRYGRRLTFDLLDHKEADLRGKGETPRRPELERLERFRRIVDEQLSSPHRLRDLAVDGDDLIALGYEPGPADRPRAARAARRGDPRSGAQHA